MRIAELSRRSGVPAATIKYYLRERLLPPGVHTSPNQVDYTDDHVARLRLIRALIDLGGLSVSKTSDILAVLDSGDHDAWETVGKAQYALSARSGADPDDVPDETASRAVDDLLSRRGWHIRPDSPARRTLIAVCAALHRLGHDDIAAAVDDYAAAIEPIAAVDLALIKDKTSIPEITETVIVATILGDSMLSALRRLAQEHASRALLHNRSANTTANRNTSRNLAARQRAR